MLRVLNTLDLDRCPEAVAAFAGVATVESIEATYASVRERIAHADAYLAALSVRIDRPIIQRAVKLKVIGSPATGTDHLDLEAIREAGVTCFDIAKEQELLRGFTATSELTFALILALNRRLIEAAAAARAGDWARERFTGFQLSGKTLGILGMGRLGRISARIGNGFGMRVIAFDPHRKDMEGVDRVDFDTLFAEADVLTIHVHLTPETRHLIDRRALSRMKPTALLINTSRGGVVDEEALLVALKTGRLAGAGLDVIDGEWRDDCRSHPLIEHSRIAPNLVITPHIGGATHESIHGARIFMARKVADYLRACTQQATTSTGVDNR